LLDVCFGYILIALDTSIITTRRRIHLL